MGRPPLRVLVVEDDPGTAAAIIAFLNGLRGVQVVGTAEDGVKGLERIRLERPELVLLDLVMPGMDGLELLRELRAERQRSRPYVIVLSGVSSDVTIQRALGLGAGFYMVKPVNLTALGERIYDRLSHRDRDAPERGREAMAHWYLEEMGGGRLTGGDLLCTAAAALADSGGTVLKVAYAEVKRVHGVAYVNAEQTIRRCIDALHRENSPAYRALMDGAPEGERNASAAGRAESGTRPPSNGAFLRRLAEKLLLEPEET